MTRLVTVYAVIFNSVAGLQAHLHHAHVVHHHHRFSGSPVGYVGLAAAAAASWIGVPGPGEPLLIAAGILAAKNKLDITSVLLVAWVSAAAGGVGGWLLGRHLGRRLVSAKGPIYSFRQAAVARGDQVFRRYPVLAIVLTPSWIAGIHHVRGSIYLPINALAALAWAVGLGLGSYYAGPAIVEVVDDIGWAGGSALVLLIAVVVGGELLRRRRLNRRKSESTAEPD
jgi:membrane protein DedA with SNARE-associated domain